MESNKSLNATNLNRNRSSPNNSNDSFKYKLDCQSRIDPVNPETKDWLTLENQISKDSTEYTLFSGLLEKKKSIVVKIGSDKLKKEYEIGNLLDNELNLPTFLGFYCLFNCLDNFHELKRRTHKEKEDTIAINAMRKNLCKTEGEQIHILVMPHIKLKEIGDYKWNKFNNNILNNVLKHVIMSLCYARNKIGFVHRDLHTHNILMQNTKRKSISYDEFGELEVLGLLPIIMDYDMSIIKKDQPIEHGDIYDDFKKIINLVSGDSDIDIVFDCARFIALIEKYRNEKKHIDKITCSKICSEIDNFVIKEVKSENRPVFEFPKPISTSVRKH